MVKIGSFLPVRNENVPHISTESLPRNVQNNTGNSNELPDLQNRNDSNTFQNCLISFQNLPKLPNQF